MVELSSIVVATDSHFSASPYCFSKCALLYSPPLFYAPSLTEIVNGEKNLLVINVDNKSDKYVTLLNIAGSVNKPDSGALIRNVSSCSSTRQLHLVVSLSGEFFSEKDGMGRIPERES